MIEAKTNKHAQNSVDSLNAAVVENLAAVDKILVARACNSFCSRPEMIFADGVGYIEK